MKSKIAIPLQHTLWDERPFLRDNNDKAKVLETSARDNPPLVEQAFRPAPWCLSSCCLAVACSMLIAAVRRQAVRLPGYGACRRRRDGIACSTSMIFTLDYLSSFIVMRATRKKVSQSVSASSTQSSISPHELRRVPQVPTRPGPGWNVDPTSF